MDLARQTHVAPTSSTSRSQNRITVTPYHAILASITLVGGIIRFWHLGSKSLWIDETFSVGMVRQDWGTFIHTILFVQPNMEAFYVTLKVATSLTPVSWQTDAFWRLLPALAGTAVIPAAATAGRRLSGTRVGLLAAALVAVNAFQVEYSQQARGYTLFVLLFLLSSIALLDWMRGRPHALIWFGALVALGFLTQAFELIFLACQICSLGLIALRGRKIAWLHLALALLPFGLLVILRLPIYSAHPDQVSWITRPLSNDGMMGIISLAGGNSSTLTTAGYLLFYLVCLALIVLLATTGFALRQHPQLLHYQPVGENAVDRVEALIIVFCWSVGAIAGTWLISQVKPIWVPRYLAPASVGICLLLALALHAITAWLNNRHVRQAIFSFTGALLVLLACLPLHSYLARAGWEDWRSAAGFVNSQFQTGDGMLCYDNQWGCQFGFTTYFTIDGNRAQADLTAPGAFTWERYGRADREQEFAQAVDPKALAPYCEQHRRVWLLIGHYHAGTGDWQAGIAWLNAHARHATTRDFAGDIHVYLYDFGGTGSYGSLTRYS
jgi:uncharacterized membrane protein